ncbi:hypothetical protein ACJX0J_005772, partial [Zea mays]
CIIHHITDNAANIGIKQKLNQKKTIMFTGGMTEEQLENFIPHKKLYMLIT